MTRRTHDTTGYVCGDIRPGLRASIRFSVVLLLLVVGIATQRPRGLAVSFLAPLEARGEAPSQSPDGHDTLTDVVRTYCRPCHNDRMLSGNVSLDGFEVDRAAQDPQTAARTERIIRKLRANLMPPPGVPRPDPDTLRRLVETLEHVVDQAAASDPNPGFRSFQRLNRYEYEQAIRQLLALDIDAGDYLPLDTMSANFDNIADAQMLSATLLDAYLTAAAEISRLAVGDPNARPEQVTYSKSRAYSQWDRVEGAPSGTRGGISVVHNFPADGQYRIALAFQHTTTGGLSGSTIRNEEIEVSIDGKPVARLHMDQWLRTSDPNGVTLELEEPILVAAGPQRVSAVFLRQFEGPVEDVLSPHEWSIVDTEIGDWGYGITSLPHIRDLTIDGPYDVTGLSETPSRRAIFTCRPTAATEARACAESILRRLARDAYRRSVTAGDLAPLLRFYEAGAAEGGFEAGVRTALQSILASPDFVFRFEPPGDPVPGTESYAISGPALATRLSFFLWGTPPDAELLDLAHEGRLSESEVLARQTRRMLADPRAEALATRFAALWLRLGDIDLVQPDAFWFPDFDRQLAEAMRRETELVFYHLVQEDRSFLELFTADYTYVNERLARHYGIPGVVGPGFRRVAYPTDQRRGLLGHGSVLLLTSLANRTSPVLRGKWVLNVLMGTPPPPPPPAVPDLEDTASIRDGRALTTRERMEIHRANPTCNACHRFMDPVGLALENFDVLGRWRIREHGVPLDTRGELWDGTLVENPADLRAALLANPVPLVRTFTENLMAFAIGRRVEWYDMPTIRAIARDAAAVDYRMSSFILGVVRSPAFSRQRAPVAATPEP